MLIKARSVCFEQLNQKPQLHDTKMLFWGLEMALSTVLSNPLPAAAGFVACIFILARLLRRGTLIRPAIGHYQWDTSVAGSRKKRWMWDSLRLLREGYAQFQDKPWQVWTSEGDQVVLPPESVDELKMLPDHTLSSSLREVSRKLFAIPALG